MHLPMNTYLLKRRGLLAAALLTAALSSLFLSAFTLVQAEVINSMETGNTSRTLLILCISCFLFTFLFSLADSYLSEKLYCGLSIGFKNDLLRKFLAQQPSDYGEKPHSEHLSFLTNEVNAVLAKYFYMAISIMKQVILMLISLSALLFANFRLGLVLIAVSLIFLLLTKRAGGKLTQAQDSFQKQNQLLTGRLTELLKNYEMIHNYQIQPWAEKEFTKQSQSMEEAKFIYSDRLLRVETMNVGGNMLTYLCVLVIGSFLALREMAGLGIVLSLAELTYQVMSSGAAAANCYAYRKSCEGLKEKCESLLAAPEPGRREQGRTQGNEAVVMRDVSFAYEDNLKILENASLVLEKGKKYALMGESGIGKSTVLQLILKQYEPQEGKILILGQEGLTEKEVLDRTGAISQAPFIYEGTIAENITMFDEQPDRDRLLSAAAAAGLLGGGNASLALDGEAAPKGANLSQGQKQRVEIARAVYSGKELLLMDEMTAALDPDTAALVEKNVMTGPAGKTVLHVTHRIHDPSCYDLILELRDHKFAVTGGKAE